MTSTNKRKHSGNYGDSEENNGTKKRKSGKFRDDLEIPKSFPEVPDGQKGLDDFLPEPASSQTNSSNEQNNSTGSDDYGFLNFRSSSSSSSSSSSNPIVKPDFIKSRITKTAATKNTIPTKDQETSDSYTDVNFKVDGKIFRSSRYLLAKHSSYFSALLKTSPKDEKRNEIEIPGVTKRVFGIILELIDSSSNIKLSFNDALNVCPIAHRWQMKVPMNKCIELLKNVPPTIKTLNIYNKYDKEYFKTAIIEYMITNDQKNITEADDEVRDALAKEYYNGYICCRKNLDNIKKLADSLRSQLEKNNIDSNISKTIGEIQLLTDPNQINKILKSKKQIVSIDLDNVDQEVEAEEENILNP